MISIDGHHPDLEKFITHKSDLGITQGANMSVRMTDDFFNAVKNDEDWVTEFTREETNETITKTAKAREIMELIAKTNWDYAEPGLLYWDTIKNYNLMSEDKNFSGYAGTNPCVTGDTLVLTEFGYYPIRGLVGTKVNIWNGYEWSEVVPQITGTNQPIMRIEFSDGSSIKCTNYHKFIMEDSDDHRVEAKDLKVGDTICRTEFPIIEGTIAVDDKVMYTKGFLAGDGTIDERGRNLIYLYGDKMDLLPYLDYERCWDQRESSKRYCIQLDSSKYILMADKFYVPTSYNNIRTRLNWLAGCIDADGTLNDKYGAIAITSINRPFLQEIKLMLQTLGCDAKISINKIAGKKMMPDGHGGYKEYECATSYRIIISAFYVNRLMQLGLQTRRVPLISRTVRNLVHAPKIVSITPLGIADYVFCVNEGYRHSVVFGGIRTSNCGEQPLPAGGSCLLGAMNLSAYWNRNIGSFEYSKFAKDVRTAVRFLNEVLDEGQPLHPLKEQRECVGKWRQIGLGFMGLADLFIKAGYRYGSKKSINLVHHIGYVMIANAIVESIELAKEYGAFEDCNPEAIISSSFWDANITNNPYLGDKDVADITDSICKYGIRNSQLLTCAPTGTISTIFNISGGIEPVFALQFTRTTKSIYDEDRTYTVYPKAVEEFMKDNNIKSLDELEELPDFLITSRDISWRDRINVQAAWQKHIDASISATINLPESTTVDDIVNLYMYAHDAGLKGTTVFRENCKRIAILYDTYNKKSEDKEEDSGSDIGAMAKTILDKAIESTGIPKELILGSGDDKDALSIIETLILRDKERYADTEPTEDIKASEAITEVPDEKKEHVKPMVKDTTDEEFVNLIKNKFANSFTRIATRADFKEELHGTTYYKRVACGHIYITVNRFLGRPVEVFMQSSKSGGCAANTEALGRLASTMLRAGIDPDIVVDSTLGVKCSACSAMKGKGENIDGLSCSDVMARVIRDEYQKYTRGEYDNEILEYVSKRMSYGEKWELLNQGSPQNKTSDVLEESKKIADKLISKAFIEKANEIKAARWDYKDHTVQENIDHYICPECGHSLRLAEGCMVCDNCGFSKC